MRTRASRRGGGPGAGPRRDPQPAVTMASRGVRGPGSRLPHFAPVQKAFGRFDLSGVRAYSGSAAERASAALHAAAYTTGNKVAFASRQPTLHTVAHEATHTLQQAHGLRLDGGLGRAGDRFERQADAVADAVVRGESAEPLLAAIGASAAHRPARPQVQRTIYIGKEPNVPGNWRAVTDEVYDGNALAWGGGPFDAGRRDDVLTNNRDNSNPVGGAAAPAPVVPGGTKYLKSDVGMGPLLPADEAVKVAPEVDHIVPRAEGGSNSLNNARVLSKKQNNDPATARPANTLAQTAVRVYNDYKVTEGGVTTKYNDGDRLPNLGAINQFYEYATGFTLGNIGALDRTEMERIVSKPINKTRNGIKIQLG